MSDVPELDDIAARALACIILDATADVVGNGGDTAATDLQVLADDTGLTLDVCAAIMFATTALCVAGDIDAASITGASMALEPDDDNAPEATFARLGRCPVCDRRIADTTDGGCELSEGPVPGQRWCLWHVPADLWVLNFGDDPQPDEPQP